MKIRIIKASSESEAESRVNEFAENHHVKNVQIETFFDGKYNMMIIASIVYNPRKVGFGE